MDKAAGVQGAPDEGRLRPARDDDLGFVRRPVLTLARSAPADRYGQARTCVGVFDVLHRQPANAGTLPGRGRRSVRAGGDLDRLRSDLGGWTSTYRVAFLLTQDARAHPQRRCPPSRTRCDRRLWAVIRSIRCPRARSTPTASSVSTGRRCRVLPRVRSPRCSPFPAVTTGTTASSTSPTSSAASVLSAVGRRRRPGATSPSDLRTVGGSGASTCVRSLPRRTANWPSAAV